MEGIRAKVKGRTAEEDDTPAHLAQQLNVDVAQLVWLNKEWYPSLHANSPLQAGTVLQIPDTPGALEGDCAPDRLQAPFLTGLRSPHTPTALCFSSEASAACPSCCLAPAPKNDTF